MKSNGLHSAQMDRCTLTMWSWGFSCVDIANTIQGGFPHECNKYFDFLTVAGYAMTGLNGVDKDSCCSDLTAFTQGCHITGEGEIGQYPYYPVGWLWDTNHLEHNFINYSRTLVPALNVSVSHFNSFIMVVNKFHRRYGCLQRTENEYRQMTYHPQG